MNLLPSQERKLLKQWLDFPAVKKYFNNTKIHCKPQIENCGTNRYLWQKKNIETIDGVATIVR